VNQTANRITAALRDLGRLLTFRLSRDGFRSFDRNHLIVGLVFTWLVGMGRWWDDPGANLLQHLGVGSVVYVFVLAGLLWLVVRPFSPDDWSFRHVLTFVALTSPPAILYAIRVERFTELSTAREINVWFLATVAAWRVALLLFYLRRSARLTIMAVILSALLPIMAIIATLTVLNLERAVFDIMGGLRETGTSNDSSYAVLFLLTFLSTFLVIPVFFIYLFTIAAGGRRPEKNEDRDMER
jgi:hypothetical protein